MDFTYFSVLPAFYNPFGVSSGGFTNSVLYNGTPAVGGGTNYATYSLTASETVSQALLDVWDEWHVAYLRDATNETNIASNTTAISAINTALSNLKTSSLQYNGTVKTGGTSPNPTYSMTSNEALNTILVSVWDEFTAIYTAITGISTGVTLTTLNNTLKQFVTDFSTGLGNTSNTLLVATIGSGIASIGGQYVTYAGGTIGVSASQDNYVYLKNDGTLVYKHVNNGSGQPSTDAGTYILWKLVTDPTSITTTTDKRNPYPFNGSQLAANSIPDTAFTNASVSLARLKTDVTDKLLPTPSILGSVLASDGSDFVENTNINVGTNALGVGTAATSGLSVAGSALITSDGRTDVGVVDMQSNRLGFYDPTKRNILRSITLPDPVITTTTDYTQLTTDYIILVNKGSAAAITGLNANVCGGQTFTIKDISGAAGANHITYTPSGCMIDGSATYVISSNYGAVTFISDGTNFYVLSKITT